VSGCQCLGAGAFCGVSRCAVSCRAVGCTSKNPEMLLGSGLLACSSPWGLLLWLEWLRPLCEDTMMSQICKPPSTRTASHVWSIVPPPPRRYGLLNETQDKLDYVLALSPQDFLERRLQTLVFKQVRVAHGRTGHRIGWLGTAEHGRA
jgi:hypothetical protein